MTSVPITFACGLYDRMLALQTGDIKPDGIDLNFLVMDNPRQIFDRMTNGLEFDACEMSSSEFISRYAAGKLPFVALPVFASRVFRHGFIVVNRHFVKSAADLAGKRIGVPLYTQTAALFVRGLMQHDLGVDLSGIEWVQGAVNEPGAYGNPSVMPLLKPTKITPNQSGKSLSDLLATGEIHAIIGSNLPDSLKRHPDVVRLFPDYRAREQDYFRRTRIFPIMHLIVIRNDIYERHPEVAASLYKAFTAAKDRALKKCASRHAALHAAVAAGRHGRDRRPVRRRLLALWRRAEPADARGAGDLYGRTGPDPRKIPIEKLFVPVGQ